MRFRRGGALLLPVLLAALLAGRAPDARAADVEVEASVDQTSITLNGQVVYTVTITGGLRQSPTPELPNMDQDFTVYSGGTSRNFSFINGQVSSSSAYNFVLTPRRAGRLTIGRTRVKIGSTVYQTDPITIIVTQPAPSSGGSSAGAAPAPPAGTEAAPAQGDQDLFVTTSVDRKNPHLQEQVTLVFRFYQRVNLLESPDYTAPPTTGFWSEDLPPQRNFNEVVKGRRYYVTEVRTALFPTAPGTFTIGPARLACLVPTAQRGPAPDPFTDPFGLFGRSQMGSRKITLESDPITVTVRPLPDGAPAGFGGAVGDYDIKAHLDKATVPQAEAVTLVVEVSGTGNIRTVPDLDFPALSEFKVYDSSSSSDVSKDGRTVRGRKVYQQILVPLKAGSLTVPPISLAFFDPARDAYRTVQTDPLQLAVTPGATPTGGGGGNRSAIEVVGQDIRFIRTNLSGLQERGQRPWESPLFWLFQIVPVGLVLGAAVYERRRRRLDEDQGFARDLRSGREAGRRLRSARKLAAGEDPGFYSAVAEAVRGYVADKFNRASAGLTHTEITTLLASRGLPAALSERIIRLLDTCDMARFAPASGGAADRERLLAEAGDIITTLRRSGL